MYLADLVERFDGVGGHVLVLSLEASSTSK